MTHSTFTRDQMFTLACIIEELVDSALPDAPRPWQNYRDQVGIAQLRDDVIDLVPYADAAWLRVYSRAQGDPEAPDPGSFDYDFLPIWLRHCVEWQENAPPRVKSAASSEAEAFGLSEHKPLACPSCGDTEHLYDRADVRYDPDADEWKIGDREGAIDCTTCDWTGGEQDLVRHSEEKNSG